MSGAMKVLKEQISVSQANDHNVAAFGKLGIEPIQQFDDVPLEFLRLGASNAASTDIIADQFNKEYHWMVSSLVAMQSFDIPQTISWTPTIDSKVLEVVIIADVPFSHIFIDRMGGVFCGCVASVCGFVRDVKLICDSGEEVAEGALVHHCDVEEFFRDREVSACGVTNYSNSESGWISTEFVL